MALSAWARDLASLELLVSVAEHGSLGKAAAAHGISQPAASTRLDRLERQCGLALLSRTPTGTTLTPAGEAVTAWVREVISAAQSLVDGVTALRQERSTRLHIAASLTVAEYLMPTWLLHLRRDNPDLEVTAEVANSHDVCDRVRHGQVDIGFVEMPTVPADLSAAMIGTDRLVLVAAPQYPAASPKRRHRMTASDLLEQPLLLREHGSGTRDAFIEAFTTALDRDGAPALPHAVSLGSTTTILATARAGGGIGVISARAAHADLASGALVEIAVENLAPTRRLNAVWLGRTPSPSANLLLQVARRADADRRSS